LHKILVDLRSKRASTETETAEKSFQVVGGFALTSLKDNWLESINRIDNGWTGLFTTTLHCCSIENMCVASMSTSSSLSWLSSLYFELTEYLHQSSKQFNASLASLKKAQDILLHK
jgi:hypothetical protein